MEKILFGEERYNMKQKAKHIEKEREREKEVDISEATKADSTATPEIIEHFSHPHPLTYYEPSYTRFRCNSCSLPGNGSRYHCAPCGFDLHKACAQSPLTYLLHHIQPEETEEFGIESEIIDTFAHPQGHSVVLEYRKKAFKCDHCNTDGDGLRFGCSTCNVAMHQVCAKHPTRLTSFMHPQHELELRLAPSFKSCSFCKKIGSANGLIYKCKVKGCEFYLHPNCSQWPQFLVHPLHPPHQLTLIQDDMYNSYYDCANCKKQMAGLKYRCQICGLDFDPRCILEQAKLGQGAAEIRASYAGKKITALPVTNLRLPESAFRFLFDPQLDSALRRSYFNTGPNFFSTGPANFGI